MAPGVVMPWLRGCSCPNPAAHAQRSQGARRCFHPARDKNMRLVTTSPCGKIKHTEYMYMSNGAWPPTSWIHTPDYLITRTYICERAWQLVGLVEAVLADGGHGVRHRHGRDGRVVQRLERGRRVRALAAHQVRRHVSRHRQRHAARAQLRARGWLCRSIGRRINKVAGTVSAMQCACTAFGFSQNPYPRINQNPYP